MSDEEGVESDFGLALSASSRPATPSSMMDRHCDNFDDASPCSIVYQDDIVDRVIERDMEQHMLSQALATTSPPYQASDAPALARAPLKPSKYGRCRVCQDLVLTFKRDFFSLWVCAFYKV